MDPDSAVLSYSEALYHAVHQRNLNLARELLAAGANVNHKSEKSFHFTPIMRAVEFFDLEMVKLLLRYNPNVNDQGANGGGELPLVEAAKDGSLEMVRTLLAHPGTIASARDSQDNFALATASEYGHWDIVELLVSHGEEYSKDEYSEALATAAARSGGATDIIRLLLEHGADPNYEQPNDDSPALYSLFWGRNVDAMRLLLRHGATFEIPFKRVIRRENTTDLNGALRWLSEDTTRTILGLKGLQQRQTENAENWGWITRNWDAIVTALWFHYFGPSCNEDPPYIENTALLSNEAFTMTYRWMILALSSLLCLDEGNLLLPHLCRVFDPSVALELCDHTDKTPLLLALEMFPLGDEEQRASAARGTDLLIEWNPEAVKVSDPKTRRSPVTCAIVNRVPWPTLQKMITCKDQRWLKMSPLQQDPVTSLPNFLLVAAGKDCYSISEIYVFSRDYLPDMISSLKSTSPRGPRRGIKRRLEQI